MDEYYATYIDDVVLWTLQEKKKSNVYDFCILNYYKMPLKMKAHSSLYYEMF